MLLGIIVLIVAVILIINNTSVIDSIQTRISNFSADNEEMGDDESVENSEENGVETTIADGYYDEENKVTWHVEEDGSMCPIPDGYVGSQVEGEDEINTGYVIYEGTDEVTDENVTTAKTSRNQYVWIPVPDVSQMYGIDSDGKKWGKGYYFSTSSNNANYDEETGTYPRDWSESNGVMNIINTREPNVSSYDKDIYLKSYLSTLGINSTHEFLIQLEKEFNSMIESVEKYGGFYIGRYETGNVTQSLNSDKAVEIQGNTYIYSTNWYNSYKMCKTLSGDNDNVETGLIWGCQWDRTLMWLIESGNKTIEEIVDSKSWGNHSNSTGDAAINSGSRRASGYSEAWKAANIYDLAGNIYEWTMEQSYSYRYFCGGYYNTTSTSASVSDHWYNFSLSPTDSVTTIRL